MPFFYCKRIAFRKQFVFLHKSIIMKVLQSSFFRALCALIVGALTIMYRDEAQKWLVIVIGVLFFLSGVISCAVYYGSRKNFADVQVLDNNGVQIAGAAPTFPLVGIACAILGGVLALMPATFQQWLSYLLAFLLVIGSINQYINLAQVSKLAKIGPFFWITPCITMLIGLVALVKPTLFGTSFLFILGWAILLFGVIEAINSIKIYTVKKAYNKAVIAAQQAVEAEEVATTTTEIPQIEEPKAPETSTEVTEEEEKKDTDIVEELPPTAIEE